MDERSTYAATVADDLDDADMDVDNMFALLLLYVGWGWNTKAAWRFLTILTMIDLA